MNSLEQTLDERVGELILSHKGRQLLSTTGTRAAIEELAARSEGLEQAIRQLALELEQLAGSQQWTADADARLRRDPAGAFV
jgi:hypothetical protein